MYPQQLIGKRAVRTMHMTMASGGIDRSFMTEPLTIKAVVQDGFGGGHIVCDWTHVRGLRSTNTDYILPYEYIDKYWTDYDALIAKANVNTKKRQIRNMR